MDGARLPRIAVIGHTNTGKTSLLRTLLRDERFGDVADRPAVTRRPEAAVLRADGEPVLELVDTPGLEDSIGLLEHLDARGRELPEVDRVGVLEAVLDSGSCAPGGRFVQEGLSLRAFLEADAGFYVVDAREPVRAKHRDELEILARCARPVVPVLNFVADPAAHEDAWREQLRRVNLHATAAFDTVVFRPEDERRLFERFATLRHEAEPAVRRLLEARDRQRRLLVRVAARSVAELLVDVAAFVRRVDVAEQRMQSGAHGTPVPPSVERFRALVREREAACVRSLFETFAFDPAWLEDAGGLSIAGGRWGLDLFDPAALRSIGRRSAGPAAAGAAIGLAVDAAVGGMSLGAAALTGAAIGGAAGAARATGRRLVDRVRGFTELRVDDATLGVLAERQVRLARTLLERGHASTARVVLGEDAGARSAKAPPMPERVRRALVEARQAPRWALAFDADGNGAAPAEDARRDDVVRTVAEALVPLLDRPEDGDGPAASDD